MKHEGEKLTVTGAVGRVDHGSLATLRGRLVTQNPFISIDASLEHSVKSNGPRGFTPQKPKEVRRLSPSEPQSGREDSNLRPLERQLCAHVVR